MIVVRIASQILFPQSIILSSRISCHFVHLAPSHFHCRLPQMCWLSIHPYEKGRVGSSGRGRGFLCCLGAAVWPKLIGGFWLCLTAWGPWCTSVPSLMVRALLLAVRLFLSAIVRRSGTPNLPPSPSGISTPIRRPHPSTRTAHSLCLTVLAVGTPLARSA